jgi:hypothetical protein
VRMRWKVHLCRAGFTCASPKEKAHRLRGCNQRCLSVISYFSVVLMGGLGRTASELEAISLDDEFVWERRSGRTVFGFAFIDREDYVSLYESEKDILSNGARLRTRLE